MQPVAGPCFIPVMSAWLVVQKVCYALASISVFQDGACWLLSQLSYSESVIGQNFVLGIALACTKEPLFKSCFHASSIFLVRWNSVWGQANGWKSDKTWTDSAAIFILSFFIVLSCHQAHYFLNSTLDILQSSALQILSTFSESVITFYSWICKYSRFFE